MPASAAASSSAFASVTRLQAPLPWPVLLVVLSFLCPSELSLYIAGLRLPPHRVALLIFVPMAVRVILTDPRIKIRAYDILFFLYSCWTLLAYSVHGEGTAGVVYGGSLALESFGGYIVARAYVRDAAIFMATMKMLIVCVIVAALFALPETIFGGYFTHDFLRKLIGGEAMPDVEKRLGFYRAASVFDHPIHLGTFCATLLALIWFAESRGVIRWACAGLVASATLLSLSSAPMLCLGLQIGLIVLERITRGIPGRLPLLMVTAVGLYLGASLASNRSLTAVIATGFTLDAWTGFYRLMIWEYGLDNVAAHPLLGIGQANWVRPAWMYSDTVDAFWLVIAMRTGIPALVMLVLAIVLLAAGVVRRRWRTRDPFQRRMAVGWMTSLVALCAAASTVHLWNVVFAYFFFFLGLAGWIADARPATAQARQVVAQPRRRMRGMPRPERPVHAGRGAGLAQAG